MGSMESRHSTSTCCREVLKVVRMVKLFRERPKLYTMISQQRLCPSDLRTDENDGGGGGYDRPGRGLIDTSNLIWTMGSSLSTHNTQLLPCPIRRQE